MMKPSMMPHTALRRWRRRLASSERVLYANTLADTLEEGDIVVWSGKKVDDMAIKCCTNSDFNHIAIVVKRGDEFELLEATGDGVSTIALEFYVEAWYWTHFSSIFHKVAVRQLSTKQGRGLSGEQKAVLRKYMAEMVGTSYQINPLEYVMSMLQRAELLERKEDFSSVFCSELVAGAYKQLGILPAERAANSYFPGDFTERHQSKLKMLDGATLGIEKRIIFEHAPAREEASTSTKKDPLGVRVDQMGRHRKRSGMRGQTPEAHSDSQRAAERALLTKAMAAYVMRKWMRKAVRERRRRKAAVSYA